MADPKAPRGTGPVGKALWAAVTGGFELEEHELALLGQITVVADRIDALDKAVTRDGVILEGKAHPALVESRLQRITLGRLLAALRLPDRQEQKPQRRGAFRGTYQLKQVLGDG